MGGMNTDEAKELQKEWGDKPCDHPDIIADSDCELGEDRWNCTECGVVLDYDKWRRSYNQRRSADGK